MRKYILIIRQKIERIVFLEKGFIEKLRRRPTLKGKFGYALSLVRAFFKDEHNVHLVFRISLVIKGIIAASEVIVGIILYFVSQRSLLDMMILATRGELREDPRDLMANFLLHTTQTLSIGTQRFTALYLLGHGIIKIFIIAGLWREKLWYYPAAIGVFGLFIAYELYQFALSYSIWLLIISMLDIVVVWLTWREYAYLRGKLAAS